MRNKVTARIITLLSIIILMLAFQDCKDDDDKGTDVGNPVIVYQSPQETITGVTSFVIAGYNGLIASGSAQKDLEKVLGKEIDISVDAAKTEEFFTHIFSNPETQSDPRGVTYHPNQNLICGAVATSSTHWLDCQKFFDNISVVQIGNQQSGTLIFQFKNLEMIEIRYSGTRIQIDARLSTIVDFIDSAIRQIEGRIPEQDEVPKTAAGKVSASIEKINSTQGRIQLSFLEKIELAGINKEGHSYEISVAPSNLLEIQFDEQSKTAAIDLHLGASRLYHSFEDEQKQLRMGEILVDSISGKLEFDEANKTIKLFQIGTGELGVQMSASKNPSDVTSDLVKITNIKLLPFDLAAEFSDSENRLNFTSIFNLDILFNKVEGMSPQAGTLSIITTGPTQVSAAATENAPIRVDQGQVNIAGSGATQGELTVETGQCFAGQETSFPFTHVDCP